MHCGNRRAIKRSIELAPFARGYGRAQCKPKRREHLTHRHRVGGKEFAQQRDSGESDPPLPWRSHRTRAGFVERVLQHGARQHILGLCMGGDTEPRHIDTDDADAVDFARQQLKRYATCSGHAQVDDHQRVIALRIGFTINGFADVFEELAGDQRFGVERHVADTAARAVEMRGEGEPVHAACRARQDGVRAPHAQAHPKRAECRAHALRLIMRALGVVGCIARQRFALSRLARGVEHLIATAVAGEPRHSTCLR